MSTPLPFIHTERLALRNMCEDDDAFTYELNSDPEVMRYTGDISFASVADARAFLKDYQKIVATGLSRWMVIDRQSGESVGWCGLRKLEDGEVDLGFRFLQRHWGKGYATEAAKACVDYGFKHHQLDYIIGRVMHDNHASARVLEKVGMTYWKDLVCEAHPARCYKIEKPTL